MMLENCGFFELEHTADWALKIWAPDLEQLLITAARGMYSLSETQTDAKSIQQVVFSLPFLDKETLLVDFLSELLFLGEVSNQAAIDYKIGLTAAELSAYISVAEIKSRKKEIKAVTFHHLEISSTERGLETVIVFDV